MSAPAPAGYTTFQVGGVFFPLSAPGTNDALRDADPTLFQAIAFWKWVIEYHVGARFMQAVGDAGLLASITQPVFMTYSAEPEISEYGVQYRWPLLAAYRKESLYKRKTAGWEDDRATFELVYVLPQIDSLKVDKIVPMLRAIEGAIRQRTTAGGDPNYTPPGGVLGQSPWRTPLGIVEEIGFTKGTFGRLQGVDGIYPTLIMEGTMVERDMPVAHPPFLGVDVTANMDATDGPTIAQVGTQPAPTIAGLTPATGGVAGGTSVSIAGTGFAGAPRVTFGATARATNVVVVSSTLITCTAPAWPGPGAVDVAIVNGDGQSVTAADAFTYQ